MAEASNPSSQSSSQSSSPSSGDGSSGSWPGLLAYLNKTFDLMRDIFGYALPGVVFFAIGIASNHLSLRKVHDVWLAPYQPPTWAQVLLGTAICYAMGHALVMLAYLPLDIKKFRLDKQGRFDEIKNYPTEVTAQALMVQRRHPEFFGVWNRRETMAMATAGIGMATLVGGVFFYLVWDFIPVAWERLAVRVLLLVVAVLLLFEFGTAIPHLRRVRQAIIEADRLTGTELASGEYERAALDAAKCLIQSQQEARRNALPPDAPKTTKIEVDARLDVENKEPNPSGSPEGLLDKALKLVQIAERIMGKRGRG